jgi:hypothetical protein
MINIRESAGVAKEHLSLEEIQLEIGDFCVSATGFTLLGADLVTGKLDFKLWMVAGVIGQAAGKSGLVHWRQGREKLGYEYPEPEDDLF